jgi:hypothetical protein
MSTLTEALRRAAGRQPPHAPAQADAALAPPPATAAPAPGRGDRRSELGRRREALARQVTELHWDLGGLAYEMAIRDHFRLDVLVRRAAVLQERDAELAEVERLLALQEAGHAGSCPRCSAPHSRGAVYCWQCGATLMRSEPASALPAGAGAPPPANARGEAVTAVMDALLAPSAPTSPPRPDTSQPPASPSG